MQLRFAATIAACLFITGCATNSARIKPDAITEVVAASADRGPICAPAKLERAVNPHEARRWRHLRWQDERGEVAPDAWRRAIMQRRGNVAYWAARGAGGIAPERWTERGPFNVGGRTRSLVVDPDNHNRLWAGAVSGGIWYSPNAGGSWTPVDDWMSNLAICCMVMDPTDPDVIYAGTGEGFFNADAIGGQGIFRSTDRGLNWSQLPSTAGWDTVNRIAVSHENSDLILASQRYGGIFRSTDGGETWANPQWAQGSFYVAFDPTNAAKAVAHLIDYDWDLNQWFHRAIYSTNGGLTWSTAAGLEALYGFGSRIELAYAASDPRIVYASCATNGGKIWRSTDGGRSYQLQTLNGYSTGVNWYANPLWVDPTDPDVLVTGGYDFYRSMDGGVTLTRISAGYMMTAQPHVDNHFITHTPGYDGIGNRRVYVCTDGGVWRTNDIYTASTNSGWINRDRNYRTTQFYGAAGDGETGLIIGGTQDNGTLRSISGSDDAHLMFGGDGGFCAVDPTDPNYCYGEYIFLQIHRSTDGGLTAGYIFDGIADAGNSANFIAPFILDPNDPDTMLAGGRRLWRTNDVKHIAGPTWQEIRGPGSDHISAISVSPGDSDIIWIGLNNGEVHRTTDGTAVNPTWTAVDANLPPDNPLPDRYIERILIDPDHRDTVYVALGGFSPDNLWRTRDGGRTWVDVTGSGATGLPNAPINGLTRHPDRPDWIYVGTEVGVFASIDGGENWSTTNDGPADASVDELVFLHNSATLLAATHGRGLFTADLTPPLFDYDFDGDIDLADFSRFIDCHTGPAGSGTPELSECDVFDADHDNDVDSADLAAFQIAYTGN